MLVTSKGNRNDGHEVQHWGMHCYTIALTCPDKSSIALIALIVRAMPQLCVLLIFAKIRTNIVGLWGPLCGSNILCLLPERVLMYWHTYKPTLFDYGAPLWKQHILGFCAIYFMVWDPSRSVRMMFRSPGDPLINLFHFIFTCHLLGVIFFCNWLLSCLVYCPVIPLWNKSLAKPGQSASSS